MNTEAQANDSEPAESGDNAIKEPRLWRDNGWTARVIKNPDDEGWAVEMTLHGQSEPALVGPWTMGRDKKNPKPLDTAAFNTLVKTAAEVVRRHEQQLQATLHREVLLQQEGEVLRITLDIVPDEDDPHALLAAHDSAGDALAKVRVAASFRLDSRSAAAWVASGYVRPR
ncbi:MAG: hypothetical protein ABIN96_12650 [Rubrivivax sp.]